MQSLFVLLIVDKYKMLIHLKSPVWRKVPPYQSIVLEKDSDGKARPVLVLTNMS